MVKYFDNEVLVGTIRRKIAILGMEPRSRRKN